MNISTGHARKIANGGEATVGMEPTIAQDLVEAREELERLRRTIDAVKTLTNSYKHESKRNDEEVAKIEDCMSWRHGFFTGRAGGLLTVSESIERAIETWSKSKEKS